MKSRQPVTEKRVSKRRNKSASPDEIKLSQIAEVAQAFMTAFGLKGTVHIVRDGQVSSFGTKKLRIPK